MILRVWKARSTADQSAAYIEHATKKVFPAIRAIQGHRGEYLLRRPVEGEVELVVLTLWDSMETVRKFAGAEPDKAVIDPEAQAILTSFDESVIHYEVVETRRDKSLQAGDQWSFR
jgi:heme-degrading monooxygenase HmoA